MVGFSLQNVTVSGTSINDYLVRWSVTRRYNDKVSSAVIRVPRNFSSLFAVDNSLIGREVVITRGVSSADEQVVFRGTIERFQQKGGVILLECDDKMRQLVESLITKSYDKNIDSSAGVGSEIYKDMVNNYSPLSASDSGVVSTGTTIVLDKFKCIDDSVFERGEQLCKIYDYQQFYDPELDEVRFEPTGYRRLSSSLVVGSNVINTPNWDTDSRGMVNNITVYGSSQEVETTEQFSGDGSTTTFTLLNSPVSVKVFVGGSLKKGGIPGSSSSYDYTVDVLNKRVVFVNPPPSGSNNVEVRYSYYVPTPTVVSDYESQSSYRKRSYALLMKDLIGVDDTETYSKKRLEALKDPFNKTLLLVLDSSLNIQPGVIGPVVDARASVSGDFFVEEVVMRYPFGPDRVLVSDRPWRTSNFGVMTVDRLRRLEQELFFNKDVVRSVIQLRRKVFFGRRYFKRSHRDVSGDGAWGVGFGNSAGTANDLSWDDADAVWGSSAYLNGLVAKEIVPGNNVYRELWFDEEFKGSGTTGDWDTTNHCLTLDQDEYGLSSSIALGYTITSARVNLPLSIVYEGPGYSSNPSSLSGLKIELSADGGVNWEEVSEGVIHTFTNTGSDLRWRLTNTNASGRRIGVDRESLLMFNVEVNP